MKRNILKNYTFDNNEETKIVSNKKIVKNAIIEEKKKTVEIPGETIATKTEPLLITHKNNQGIVTELEVKCSCGQDLIIKLEYE